MILLALALQAAPSVDRIDILVPVAAQPCVRQATDDIVVCADQLPSQTLPLPAEATPSSPRPFNPYLTGAGALAAESTPCAAGIGGCQVGVDIIGAGTAIIRGIQKVIAPSSCCEEPGEATNPGLLVRDMVRGAQQVGRASANKASRVAIDLAEPEMAGRVAP